MYTYEYPRAALTVDAIVWYSSGNSIEILLIKRAAEPYKGRWALPGGFIDMDETLEEACRRELEEETGLKIISLKQFKAFDKPDRDPRHRTISVVFSAQTNEKPMVSGGDDASEAGWFNVNNLPLLAFDHEEIIGSFIDQEMENLKP